MDERDLFAIDIAGINSTDREGHLQKIFEWYFELSLDKAKVFFATALSALISLLSDYLKGDINQHLPLAIAVALVGIACLAIGWFYYYMKVWDFDTRYIEGLILLKTAEGTDESYRRFLKSLHSS